MLTYIELNKQNLIDNFTQFRALMPKETRIMSVVKGNAYGHGQNEIVQLLNQVTDWFAVDDLQELKLLRPVSNKPAMVLGYIAESELVDLIQLDARLAVYDIKRILLLNSIGKQYNKCVPIHIKIDTELGRQGILPDELKELISLCTGLQNIKIEGVYSHFANIEDTTDFSHAQKQIHLYIKCVDFLRANGYPNIFTHISSTAGSLVHDKDSGHNSFIRLGIGLYGMWPSKPLQSSVKELQLKPVIRWITHIAQVKTLPAHYPVGYGLTYMTNKSTKIAVIPQGYSDGYDRGLSNQGEVLIHGTRCRILGRVAMNMFVVDVSHLADVKAEDEVVLLGHQGNEKITAESIADKLGTINYEITTRISPLLPRVVI